MPSWVVFIVSDLAMATRVTQLVRGARLDENGLLYVPDRSTRRRPPVSSRQDAAVTLNEHWLDYALAEYGAGEPRQALLARRHGGDVAGSAGNNNSASSEDNNDVPFVADVIPVEVENEEEGYEFPGYDDDDHPLGEAADEASAWTDMDRQAYMEEETRADSTECAICLQEYVAGVELTMVLCPGTHTFHRACLGEWLARSPSCPLCRHDLSD